MKTRSRMVCLAEIGTQQKELVREFLHDYHIELSEDADCKLCLCQGDEISIVGDNNKVTITYQKKNELFRALSFLPCFLENEIEIHEKPVFRELCYMADASRNAVLNMKTAKRLIRNLAGMGYTSFMLYTEDTYCINRYPYFGYMRGRYTEAEWKELDEYADQFGIEMIPCIQTLAHLTTALRWPDFDGYKDSDDILMVGDERTYQFVDAVLKHCRKCFRTNRIHLGMDEAHLIACGEYLKKNGYHNPSDVMLEHLNKVVQQCSDLGYHPMIWSDMFFRMQFHGEYYVSEGDISPSVIEKVPANLELVYWDYYSLDGATVAHMLDCHKQFPNPCIFAGGAWKWGSFAARNVCSLKASKIQLDECYKKGIDRIMVTSWGDDGAEASQFAALATILYFAERCYHTQVDDEWLDLRANTCFSISYENLLLFDLPDSLTGSLPSSKELPPNPCKYLLYNDLFERLMDCHLDGATAPEEYRLYAEKLLAMKDHCVFGYAFETLGYLCKILSIKCNLGIRIFNAYQKDQKDVLRQIAVKEIPLILQFLNDFLLAFRRQWYYENKTFGFTIQEIRLGGLVERIRSCQNRLEEYTDGKIEQIEELNEAALPMMPDLNGKYARLGKWSKIVATGVY